MSKGVEFVGYRSVTDWSVPDREPKKAQASRSRGVQLIMRSFPIHLQTKVTFLHRSVYGGWIGWSFLAIGGLSSHFPS